MRLANTLAALLLAVATIGAHAQATPIVIKFSHVVSPDTPKGKGSEFFARRVEALTGGRVRVEVYPNSTLYKDKEEMEALAFGAVQMIAPTVTKFGALGVPEFEVFDLPFIFDGYADAHKITRGPVGKLLFDRLRAHGIIGLAYWDNAFKSFSANRPIRKPEDFKGLRMRIQPSRVLEAQMRALGAVPLPMAFSQVYEALRTGVVDGTENPHSNFFTKRMHEVQPHMTLTNHGYLGYAVITNKKFWDSLPDDLRELLTQAMAEATDFVNQIAEAENEQALAAVRQAGTTEVHVPTESERRAFKRVLVRTHRQMESRIGKDVIDAVYEAVGFDPSRP